MTAVATHPAFESQAAFRAVMEAFATPGTIRMLANVAAPAPLAPASAALLRSLADFETPVWLDAQLASAPVVDWIRFHTGAPVTDDRQLASFAVIANGAQMADFSQFALGSEEYPDRSTTILLQVNSLHHGDSFMLEGPGIKGARLLRADPLPPDFETRMAANREFFPRGVDLVLVAGDEVAALPRSIRITRGP